MEATGPCSEVLAIALSDAGWHVSVVNPVRTKGFAQGELIRNKPDAVDTGLQVRVGQLMRPEPWVAPPPEVRELRALVDRLQSLKDMAQPGGEGLRRSVEARRHGAQGCDRSLQHKLVHLIYGIVKSRVPFDPQRAVMRLHTQYGIGPHSVGL